MNWAAFHPVARTAKWSRPMASLDPVAARESEAAAVAARDCARKARRFMPRMLAEPLVLSITNDQSAKSADDQLHRALALTVVSGGDEDLGQMMAAAPGGAVDRLHLEEVGTRSRIAE